MVFLHMFSGGGTWGIALPHVFGGCDLQEIDLLHMFELLRTRTEDEDRKPYVFPFQALLGVKTTLMMLLLYQALCSRFIS